MKEGLPAESCIGRFPPPHRLRPCWSSWSDGRPGALGAGYNNTPEQEEGFEEVGTEAGLRAFAEGLDRTAEAIAKRPPRSRWKRLCGWEEDFSGVRFNRRTGPTDTSSLLHVSPSLQYWTNMRPAEGMEHMAGREDERAS